MARMNKEQSGTMRKKDCNTMEQFKGDFDQYASAFRPAQAHSRIDLDSILVDTLQ